MSGTTQLFCECCLFFFREPFGRFRTFHRELHSVLPDSEVSIRSHAQYGDMQSGLHNHSYRN